MKAMTVLYKEYSKVLKFTNILPYLLHLLNLREFASLQYTIIQLLLTILNSDDVQSKQFHCRTLFESDGVRQLLYFIIQRIQLTEDSAEIPYGIDATILKLKDAKLRADENVYVIYMAIKIITGCIQMHSHVLRKREMYPASKP